MNRNGKFLAIAACLLLVAGCTQKKVDGDTAIVSYQMWVAPVSILVGLAATIGGILGRAGGLRVWLFTAVAAVGTVLFAPFGFFDKVVVDSTHIEARWGFWAFPTKHNIKFDDVVSVSLTERTSTSRRGRRTNYYLEFSLKTGGKEELSASNTLMQEAADELINQIKLRNIPVIDQTTH